MPDSHSHSAGPSLLPIERPLCPKCQERMNLARIMPGPKGYDLRNFECDKCDHVITVTVAIDPMHSNVLRWLEGDLRPPR
jgi:hypothetical protein